MQSFASLVPLRGARVSGAPRSAPGDSLAGEHITHKHPLFPLVGYARLRPVDPVRPDQPRTAI
jgi:hypothetical protein